MTPVTDAPLIAVVGATGQQGGAVVRALEAGRRFRVRALTRNPEKHRRLASEVVAADLDRPDTLRAAAAVPAHPARALPPRRGPGARAPHGGRQRGPPAVPPREPG